MAGLKTPEIGIPKPDGELGWHARESQAAHAGNRSNALGTRQGFDGLGPTRWLHFVFRRPGVDRGLPIAIGALIFGANMTEVARGSLVLARARSLHLPP